MYQRVTSPYLPDHEYSDYLIDQYQDILDICDAANNMPELVIRAPPNYVAAVPPPLNLSSIAGTTCTGQTILKSTLDPNADCSTISQAFNVATGDVQAAAGNPDCKISVPSICLPAACTLQKVPEEATCDALSTSFSTINLTVTSVQFLVWNPNINGLCDGLTPGDYVCARPPGGGYIPPPPPQGSANQSGQQRGGSDGTNAGTPSNFPSSTPLPAGPSTSPTPSPIQPGITNECTKYVEAQTGDYCSKFAKDNHINTAQLYAWNSILGDAGSNCDMKFFLGYYYCVAGPPVPSPSSAPPTLTSSTPAVPSPTQPGIASNCNKYAIAKSSDFCEEFAQDNHISNDNLYA